LLMSAEARNSSVERYNSNGNDVFEPVDLLEK